MALPRETLREGRGRLAWAGRRRSPERSLPGTLFLAQGGCVITSRNMDGHAISLRLLPVHPVNGLLGLTRGGKDCALVGPV